MFFGYLNKVEGEAVLLEHVPLIQQKEFWPWVRAAALSNSQERYEIGSELSELYH